MHTQIELDGITFDVVKVELTCAVHLRNRETGKEPVVAVQYGGGEPRVGCVNADARLLLRSDRQNVVLRQLLAAGIVPQKRPTIWPAPKQK